MKYIEKIINLFDRVLNIIMYSIFLALFIFGIYSIHSSLSLLDSSDVPEDIKKLEPTKTFNIKKLKEINEDIVGWIKIYNTSIDYPIVQGEDNTVYLNTNYKKEFSLSGTIFMDYRNSTKKIDNYTVLFGHNMDQNKMFGEINNYNQPKYIDTRNEGIIYLEDAEYKFTIFSYMLVDRYEELIYDINKYTYSLNNMLFEFIKKESIVYNDVKLGNDSKLIVLSTCSRSDEKKRAIIIGKIEN